MRSSALVWIWVAAVLCSQHGVRGQTCTHPLRSQKFSICGRPNVPGSTHDPNKAPGGWQSDNAFDFCATPGTYVYAIEDGVICAGCGYGWDPAWGNRFTLNAANNQYFYQHLGWIAKPKGSYVRRGELLGTIGDFRYGPTTNKFPPHLHFAGREAGLEAKLSSCSKS